MGRSFPVSQPSARYVTVTSSHFVFAMAQGGWPAKHATVSALCDLTCSPLGIQNNYNHRAVPQIPFRVAETPAQRRALSLAVGTAEIKGLP
ncbi:hypothetical protein [Lonsdalea quercina]|uniref:hypothetical protein n=1 Tax=Lonsdalea quercina TaxID=71657 RepID=UPI003977201A